MSSAVPLILSLAAAFILHLSIVHPATEAVQLGRCDIVKLLPAYQMSENISDCKYLNMKQVWSFW